MGYTLPRLRDIVALSEGTAAASAETCRSYESTGATTVRTEERVSNTLAAPTARLDRDAAVVSVTNVGERVVSEEEARDQHRVETNQGFRPTLASTFERNTRERLQRNLCVDALSLALNHGYNGIEWYVPTTNLEMACLDLCVACRNLPTTHIVVVDETHTRIWLRHNRQEKKTFRDNCRMRASRKKRHASRCIPALEVRSITWELSPACISGGSDAFHANGGGIASRLARMLTCWGRRSGFSRAWWPASLRKITFGFSFNHSVADVVWPDSLQELVFGFCFNRPVKGVAWPASLECLTFGFHFNQAIDQVVWPASLRHLTFGAQFQQKLHMVKWGDSEIECLTFGGRLGNEISLVVWPPSLRELTLGECSRNFRSVKWPLSLTRLTLGDGFDTSVEAAARQILLRGSNVDHPLGYMIIEGYQRQPGGQLQQDHRLQRKIQVQHGVFPANLQILTFGGDFNRPIRHVVWPPSLLQITFGETFNRPVQGVKWPASLQQLTFGGNFNQTIGRSFPESLRRLSLGGYDQRIVQVSWPALLRHLSTSVCEGDIYRRPTQRLLSRPAMEDRRRRRRTSLFDQATMCVESVNTLLDEPCRFNSDMVVWPVSLLHLTFGDRFNGPIKGVVWPPYLRRLVLGADFNRPVEGVVWPRSLRILSFGGSFNKPITKVVWPAALQTLTFGDNFNKPIERVRWPTSLQSLTFGGSFNMPIGLAAWPASLRRLTFGSCFNRRIDNVVWPTSLQHLTFGFLFDQPIHRVSWSPGLLCLEFGCSFDQPLHQVVWPPALQRITFGRRLNYTGGHIQWPASLRHLTVCEVDQPIAREIPWPGTWQ